MFRLYLPVLQQAVTYSLDDSALASISGSGVISGIATGSVTITATAILDETITTTFVANVTSAQWKQETTPPWAGRQGFAAAVFNNELYIVGGQGDESALYNDVYKTDGTTWTELTSSANFSKRDDFELQVFNDKLWLFAGDDAADNKLNDVWYSEDGITWVQATDNAGFTSRNYAASAVFKDKLWIMGGADEDFGDYDYDVFSSTDGTNWSEIEQSVHHWSRRAYMDAIVFNNKMWIIGGYLGDGNSANDVWNTSDGANWNVVPITGDIWSERSSHCTLVHEGKIWMIGGEENTPEDVYHPDVWYSSDGATWTQLQVTGSQWVGRSMMSCASFEGKIWVMGGFNAATDGYQEVWTLEI